MKITTQMGTFDVPTIKLKSGAHIMSHPMLGHMVNPNQPRHQPACYMSYYKCKIFTTSVGGRLPTEDEWIEAFNISPYYGGSVEWTSTLYDSPEISYVVRGGSWGYGTDGPITARRFWNHPLDRNVDLGFRVVWD